MKRLISATLAVAALATVSACGGGSHSAPPQALTPPTRATSAPKATGRATASLIVKFTAVNRIKAAKRLPKGARAPKFVDANGGYLHIESTSSDLSMTATKDVLIDTAQAAAGQQTIDSVPVFAPSGTLTITERDFDDSIAVPTGTQTVHDYNAPMAAVTAQYMNIVPGTDQTLSYTGASSDTLSAPLILAPIADVLQISDANGYAVNTYFFLNANTNNPITYDYTIDPSIFTSGGLGVTPLPILDTDGSGYCLNQYHAPFLTFALADSQGAYQTVDGQPLFAAPQLTVLSMTTLQGSPTPTPNPSASPTAAPSPPSLTYSTPSPGFTNGSFQPVFPYIDGVSKTQINAVVTWTGIDPNTLQTATFRVPLTIVGPPLGNGTVGVPGGLCALL